LKMGGLENVSITPLVQKQAVYIYREGLTNARRYAQAKHIYVNLEHVNNGILIQVVDDGVGFDPNLIRSDHHLGLSILQVRTERVGGTLSIETAPGKGTTISAWLPAVQQFSNLSNQEFG